MILAIILGQEPQHFDVNMMAFCTGRRDERWDQALGYLWEVYPDQAQV